MQRLFIILQYLTPQHGLSRLIALFADSSLAFIKTPFIRLFIKRYKVDMSEAKITDISQFESFNHFFTRQLKPGARLISELPDNIVSPADGAISEIGRIDADQILQAKGRHYSAVELLGGQKEDAAAFMNGSFVTIYLSPKDYHRVHMPLSGKLLKTIYVPGRLFSVNQATANSVPGLFARNERLVCFFETQVGPVAVVLVGAMIVAGIETVWAGRVCPTRSGLKTTNYCNLEQPIQLDKGDELGRFCLGSTAIVLFPADVVSLNSELRPMSPVKLGERLATISEAS